VPTNGAKTVGFVDAGWPGVCAANPPLVASNKTSPGQMLLIEEFFPNRIPRKAPRPAQPSAKCSGRLSLCQALRKNRPFVRLDHRMNRIDQYDDFSVRIPPGKVDVSRSQR